MKVIKKIIKYAFIVVFLSSASCNGSDDQDIPTGDHSFYCYIDGELFVPRGNPNFSTSPDDDGLHFLEYDAFFSVTAKDYRKYTVFFNTINREIGTVTLKESNGNSYFYNYSINHAIVRKNGILYLSKENSGTITFIESNADNVKGTFEFTLYNENDDNDTIQVTNGHFND